MASKAPLARVRRPDGPAWPRHKARPWIRRHRPRLSPDMLLRAIPSFPRPVLARLTERLIDRMDELAGDPDLEAEPDGEDTHDAEAEEAYD